MTIYKSLKWLLLLIISAWSCKEPYDPKLTPAQTNYLVVEGFINARGATTIKLSRTIRLDTAARQKPELKAQVRIIGENNSTYTVWENGNGFYTSDSIILNSNQKYRLMIKTNSGGEYLSEYSPVRITPAIDSVSWKADNEKVDIFVNSHDATDNSRYYKWDYEETWELNSLYTNRIIYSNRVVTVRDAADIPKFYYCWNSTVSNNILLGSSAHLTNDVISLAPIISIPIASEKLGVRYSILVKQSVLDRGAYDFYRLMKSNTESIGSIFDPQPSDITGNITCVSNPSEKVIGYVSVATVTQKRIFILPTEVKATFRLFCPYKIISTNPDSVEIAISSGFVPFGIVTGPGGSWLGFEASAPHCIDCNTRGSNIKPDFW